MAIIPRKLQKIFAGAATNNGVFGSAQDGTKVLSNDLDDLQGLPAWLNGWLDAVISGRQLPPLEEDQAVKYVLSTQLAYLFQEGIAEYNDETEYRIDSIVKKSGTAQVYISLTNANIGNALTDPTKWQAGLDLGGAGPISGPTKIKLRFITASGTYTPTANFLFGWFIGVGGGAGAGGGEGSSIAGGGGGAATAMAILTALQIGASQAATIGAGGIGLTGVSANAGGNTSLGSLLAANGGGAPSTGVAGLGATTGTGDLIIPGSDGGPGTYNISVGGSGLSAGGPGGGTFFGEGAPEPGMESVAAGGNGISATVYGAGGSAPAVNGTGGSGKAGCIVVLEFLSA